MNAAKLIEILMSFKPDAKVIIANNEGVTFHEVRDVGDEDPDEVVLWPDPAPLVEDEDEIPPGTLPH